MNKKKFFVGILILGIILSVTIASAQLATVENGDGFFESLKKFFLSFINIFTGKVTESCGNGIAEGTEECDDGNTIDGDGCSSICTVEEAEEIIDDIPLDGGVISIETHPDYTYFLDGKNLVSKDMRMFALGKNIKIISQGASPINWELEQVIDFVAIDTNGNIYAISNNKAFVVFELGVIEDIETETLQLENETITIENPIPRIIESDSKGNVYGLKELNETVSVFYHGVVYNPYAGGSLE